MTTLRKRMTEDLKIRNYARATISAYVAQVSRFAQHFGKSPEHLGLDHVRTYQLHLLKSEVSWSTYNQTSAALRFFYRFTLRRGPTELKAQLASPMMRTAVQ